MSVLAIDPGNERSAFCLCREDYLIYQAGKMENAELLDSIGRLRYLDCFGEIKPVIEMVASYGMPVGREVFETCVWIGRFAQQMDAWGFRKVDFLYRAEEKHYLCHDSRAKDANIRQALIDRFAKHDLKNGKGNKKNPDVFYGFSKDMWSAAAVAVCFLDKVKEGGAKV